MAIFYHPPANIDDYDRRPEELADRLRQSWHDFIAEAISDRDRGLFYDAATDQTPGAPSAPLPIPWNGFPRSIWQWFNADTDPDGPDLEAARMIGVAHRILRRRDLAEEAVHDAFVRIWRGAGGFDPARGAARSWLYAIVRNRALTILRDEGRFAAEDSAIEPQQPETATERLPENSALKRCLEALAPMARSAIVFAYVHGMSHGEIAGKLGVPLGTAKSWTRRGLLSLQKCMG